MTLIENWREVFVEDDAHRSTLLKRDLVYLIGKYGRKSANGNPPTNAELTALPFQALYRIWWRIKPSDFGVEEYVHPV